MIINDKTMVDHIVWLWSWRRGIGLSKWSRLASDAGVSRGVFTPPLPRNRHQLTRNEHFLVVFFLCVVSCWPHASGAFFACCSTCKVLISTQIISVQWVAIIVYSWNLPSFFDFFFQYCGWTFGESNSNKSFQIWRVSETRRLVSTLPLWPLILSPQIRLRENREWNTCFRPRNSQIVYQLSPLYRLYRYVRRQKVWFFSRFGLK